MTAPPLWCATCGTACGHDWRECWVHARTHGRLLGTDWACTLHEAEREAAIGHAHTTSVRVTADA